MKLLHPKIEACSKTSVGDRDIQPIQTYFGDRPIVFFDGDCVMCDGLYRFIARN